MTWTTKISICLIIYVLGICTVPIYRMYFQSEGVQNIRPTVQTITEKKVGVKHTAKHRLKSSTVKVTTTKVRTYTKPSGSRTKEKITQIREEVANTATNTTGVTQTTVSTTKETITPRNSSVSLITGYNLTQRTVIFGLSIEPTPLFSIFITKPLVKLDTGNKPVMFLDMSNITLGVRIPL